MEKKEIIENFLKLFDGCENAYGQHYALKESETGKMEGRVALIRNTLTKDIVWKHLDGSGNSLGIIPLKKDGMVKFGVIDIDSKHPINPRIHSIEEIEKKVNKLELPLITCQSKSKDVHLYCFVQEKISATIMKKNLQEWAALIGYGSSEIFPKQVKSIDNTDVGNWINIPYFDHENTIRYAINKGKKLKIQDFFKLANVVSVSKKEMSNFQYNNVDENYNDAPPCLQTLINIGVEEGSRNNGLYNFAVYFKNKYPDNYEEKVMEINGKLFSPALSLREVESTIKSVKRKDFFYKCNEYPICQFCNKTECKKRKFGIGNHYGTNLDFENLNKYVSNDSSVKWYAEYNGQRIKLTTDELLNQKLLARKMLDITNSIFTPIKQDKWMAKLEQLLKNCIITDDPLDASAKGQFKELVDTFLTDGVSGSQKKDLLKYNTYLDEKEDKIYFKSSNLFTYLKNKRFNYEEQESWHWLKEMGGDASQMRIGSKKIRVWCLPIPEFYKEDEEIV